MPYWYCFYRATIWPILCLLADGCRSLLCNTIRKWAVRRPRVSREWWVPVDLPDSGTQHYRLELASVSGGLTLDHPPALHRLEGEPGNRAESAFCKSNGLYCIVPKFQEAKFLRIGILQNFVEIIFADWGLWLVMPTLMRPPCVQLRILVVCKDTPVNIVTCKLCVMCWNKLASWDGYRNIQHWGNGLWVPRWLGAAIYISTYWVVDWID